MNSKQFRYTVGSWPDCENLVLDIFANHEHLLEVTQEPGHSFEMDIYPPHEGDCWKLDLEGFKEILERGIKRFEDFYIDSPPPMNHISQHLSYSIVSVPGHKNPVLHIFVDSKQLLEISKESGNPFEIKVYPLHDRKILKSPLQDGDFWKLDYLEFKKIFDEGMKEFEQLF